MKQVIEYITIAKDNFELLDKIVNEKIKMGFQPYGNPYVTEDKEFLACQAMVRYKDETRK